MSSFNPVFDPRVGEASRRRFDPYPDALLALDFAGVNPSGRPFYKRDGIISPRFEMMRGASSVGHAGFGTTIVNGAYETFAPNTPLIGDRGLLVPEARTNICLRSRDFTAGIWAANDTVAVNNQYASPDGEIRGGRVTEGDSGGQFFAQAFTITPGTIYTASPWLRRVSGADWYRVAIWETSNPNNQIRVWVNLATGEVGQSGAVGSGFTFSSTGIENAGGGWYRVTLTGSTSAITAVRMAVVSAQANGNAARVNGSVYGIWQGQFEAGSFASPPIFTEATAATRTALDQRFGGLTPPSGDWRMQGSVELLGDPGSTQRFVDWNDGTNNNKIIAYRNTVGGVQFRAIISSAITELGTFADKTGPRLVAWGVRREGGNIIATCDGVDASPVSVGSLPGLNEIQLGAQRGSTGQYLNGHLRNVSLRYG